MGDDTNTNELNHVKSNGFSIYSWNINGIRTLNMPDVLKQLNADIVAVQETKIAREQLDAATAFISDCSSYFSFCRNKPGYSGVATYCVKGFTPLKAEEGLTDLLQVQLNKVLTDPVGNYVSLSEEEKVLARYNDADGRCVITQHLVQKPDGEQVPLIIFNLYCPRLRDEPEDPVNNTNEKYLFHILVEKRARVLVQSGSFVLIVGDFNISHTFLDHAEGIDTPEFKESLFRQWMDQLFSESDQGFQDTFRYLHPNTTKAFSCWNSKTNARQNNYGSRIDYIVADTELMKFLESADIHPDIMGSDHCPISAVFHSLTPIASTKIPTFATKYYPELSGTQKTIKDFFNNAPKFKRSEENKPSVKTTKAKQLTMSAFLTKKPRLDSSDSPNGSNSTINAESLSPSDMPIPAETSPPLIQKLPQRKPNNFLAAFSQKSQTPLCTGHNEPCLQKTVRKKGPTQGKQFWSCPRGVGHSSDPNANCNYFQWVSYKNSSTGKDE